MCGVADNLAVFIDGLLCGEVGEGDFVVGADRLFDFYAIDLFADGEGSQGDGDVVGGRLGTAYVYSSTCVVELRW